MNSEPIIVKGLDDDEQDILSELDAQLCAKTPRNLLRACYYDGKRAIRQVGSIIPPQYFRLGLVLGWSAKAVDTLSRRCNLDRFVWPDGDLDDLGIGEVSTDNNLETEVSGAMISSLIHGVSFLVTTKGGDGEPAALMHVKDAMNATGLWNARLRRLDALLSVTRRDHDSGDPTALTLYLDGVTVTCEADGGWRVVDRQPHAFGVPAEPLVYRPRPGRPFGLPRISRTVMSLHDQAIRTVIRMEGHADVYSFPEMWLLGADESLFKNADGSQKAVWQVMLGRLKAIPDDDDATVPRAEVKQFSASSPQPHIDQLKQQAQLFSGETSIPLTSLGVSDMSNPTSAESYIASREDLIAEAEGATDDWGPALARTVTRLLAIANETDGTPAEWASIAPKWRSPIHLSRAAAADAGTKQLSAVPWLAETEVGLELLGLDDQQIRRAMAERRRLSGSAALNAITAAVDTAAEDPAAIKAKADAMGVLIRSGVEPDNAARIVGFTGLGFTGAVPTSLRQPKEDAENLEGSAGGV